MPSEALRLAVLFVTVTTCLLGHLTQVSDQSHLKPVRHYFEWPTGERDDQDAQLEAGQSRALGGESMRKLVNWYPWFNILFRNPQATLNDFARPLDGYTTGYAIEVAHNVFLSHKETIRRASHVYGKTMALQGWRRVFEKTYLDPFGEFVWGEPKDGSYRGVVRLMADIGPSFGLYRIRHEKYPFAERAGAVGAAARSQSARSNPQQLDSDGQPPFDYPQFGKAQSYEFVRLNKNMTLSSNCYLMAMAGPAYVVGGRYDGRANRTFSRWPVKLLNCERDDCVFAYDESRAISPTQELKFRGWQCDTWQDVGAPIMCGNKGTKEIREFNPIYYHKRFLLLSYVVLPTRPYDTRKAGCYQRVHAIRIADHVDKIEQSIDKWKKAVEL